MLALDLRYSILYARASFFNFQQAIVYSSGYQVLSSWVAAYMLSTYNHINELFIRHFSVQFFSYWYFGKLVGKRLAGSLFGHIAQLCL